MYDTVYRLIREHFERQRTSALAEHTNNRATDGQLVDRLSALKGMEEVVVTTMNTSEKWLKL